MSTLRHIACCLDDSDAARGALTRAAALRALGPGRLSVVHVAAPPPPPNFMRSHEPGPAEMTGAAEEWLEDQIRGLPDVEAVLLTGDEPAVEVCAWAAGTGVDLLMVAAHHSRTERALLGSFSSHVAHHAPCDVYLVRSLPE